MKRKIEGFFRGPNGYHLVHFGESLVGILIADLEITLLYVGRVFNSCSIGLPPLRVFLYYKAEFVIGVLLCKMGYLLLILQENIRFTKITILPMIFN